MGTRVIRFDTRVIAQVYKKHSWKDADCHDLIVNQPWIVNICDKSREYQATFSCE